MVHSNEACLASLEAFEAYAAGLHGLLGSTEAVSQALGLLLRCFDGCPAKASAGATGGAERAAAVVQWCLGGRGLQGDRPEAVGRVLLIRSEVLDGAGDSAVGAESAAGAALLAAAPPVLAAAPEPIAEHLSESLAGVLPSAGAAAAWLRSLQARPDEQEGLDRVEAARAYAHTARSLLARYPEGEVMSEAWGFATRVMKDSDSSQRKVCLQRLLPPLVAATAREEAAARLSGYVEQLVEGSSRAEVTDALHLTVAFHGLLLDHWHLASLCGEQNELGPRLIATCLRFGLKECHSIRKEARFLLQTAVQAALSDSSEEQIRRVAGTGSKDLSSAWRSYWELFDSIEDYSSHLLKSSWDLLLERLMGFLQRLPQASTDSLDEVGRRPPVVFAPLWLEVFFSRAFGHDNDSVQKFVLGELLKLDQRTAQLSESFVLEEVLPRFSHSIDSLYPRSDVTQTFERQVTKFFHGFVQRHQRGAAWAARQLLLAVLRIRAVHHTPLRLVFSTLLEVDAPGALTVVEALDVVEEFFARVLTRMPVSVRQPLALLFVGLVTRLCCHAPAEEASPLAGPVAKALVSIPDNLLLALRAPLSAMVEGILGADALTYFVELLRGLTSSRPADCPALTSAGVDCQNTLPMVAAMMTLGTLRGVWTCCSQERTPEPCATVVWPALAPALNDIHLRPYLPQHVAVAALLGCAYSAALLPDGAKALAEHPEMQREVLAYVEARASAALAEGTSAKDEAAWVWLYALILERLWCQGLPHGEAIAESAMAVLRKPSSGEEPAETVLSYVAATSLLGALAPNIGPASRRAEMFIMLWRAQIPKPQLISDARFQVDDAEGKGSWLRNRLEEYEDLHRMEREGLGRVLEWRDTTAVFLVAKWRALSKLSESSDVLASLAEASVGASVSLQDLGTSILTELEMMQPPHVAFWAVVARRVAYPLVFNATTPEDRQREALQTICRGLRGAIAEGTGDSSTYMPRGCLAELAAALCDPHLCKAEHRLFPGKLTDDAVKPLSETIKSLLALGDVAVGISRSVAVPILASLIQPWSREDADSCSAPPEFADVLVELLFHSEGAIVDGALCHSPGIAAGVVDRVGPGSEQALSRVCPAPGALGRKFGNTQGLPRILALTALDGLAERGGKVVPPLIFAVLQRLLSILRETLEQLIHPTGGKASANRPPTPMPASAKHRTQLRGWQAVLVLGCHADRETAAMLLPELFFHLQVPHVPDVRDYQELLGCMLCARFEDLAVESLLVPGLRTFDSGVQVSASLLIISSYLFRRWAALGTTAEHSSMASLVRATAPYLAHNAAYVRGIAAWGFFEIFRSLGSEGLASMGISEPLFGELYRFLVESKECQKMRGRLKPVFADFDPESRSGVSCLIDHSTVRPDPFNGSLEAAGESGSALHIFSDAEFHPTETFLDLLKNEVADEMATLWDRADPSQYPSNSESWQDMLLQAGAQQARGTAGAAGGDEATPETQPDSGLDSSGAAGGASGLQRKFCPPTAPEAPCEQGPRWTRRPRAPLLVIASLVDKAPNLAGLCRTSEVFNCQALCMANTKMTRDQAFQSISVTAEKWLPIHEVPRAALRSHLLGLRRQGYALVGVEQTHTSVPLDEWQFAPNTALVLGAEKEGIDAELLPLLDACVEIPQSGQLRSLNVHVSGSLVIWEYMRQQRRAPC